MCRAVSNFFGVVLDLVSRFLQIFPIIGIAQFGFVTFGGLDSRLNFFQCEAFNGVGWQFVVLHQLVFVESCDAVFADFFPKVGGSGIQLQVLRGGSGVHYVFEFHLRYERGGNAGVFRVDVAHNAIFAFGLDILPELGGLDARVGFFVAHQRQHRDQPE